MKFNEFKPQLTEEQIVLAYCKGDITKKDAVSHLSEMKVNLSEISLRDLGNKLSFGAIDSTAQQAAQDKALKDFKPKAGNTANQNVKAKIKAGQAGIDSVANLPGFSVGANKAQAAPLPKAKGPFKSGDGAEVDDFRAMPKTPPKPAARAKVKATAANTRDYDQTMAMQKKLIAQGANIKADGLMGPNTRAAMKAAGMGAKKPVAKKKLSGPDALSKLADIPAVSRALGARGELSKDDGEFADPNAMTRRKPKVAKPWVNPDGPGKTQMPRAFGLKSMPRIDSPKGGDKAAFGGKTLSKKDYAAAFGGDN